jgi:hypothetical protein
MDRLKMTDEERWGSVCKSAAKVAEVSPETAKAILAEQGLDAQNEASLFEAVRVVVYVAKGTVLPPGDWE